jgi:3-hydroxyisobutyrate dehydrogenase-like beta-hydroxyacid dehydrogenase
VAVRRAAVGVISPGAMGSAVGRSLAAAGHRVLVSVAGLEPAGDLETVVAGSDIVLSIVPPGSAGEVAARVALAAQATDTRPLLADLNAVSPARARELEQTVGGAGIDLVDGSISGPPPRPGGATRLYLSGSRADEIAALEPDGVQIAVLGDRVGLASALKMCTASVYKGTALLLTHACRTALVEGVLDEALADLAKSSPELVEGVVRSIATAAAKSGRYVAEMREIAATQDAAGLTPDLFEAIAECYAAVARTPLAGDTPEQAAGEQELVAVLERLEAAT